MGNSLYKKKLATIKEDFTIINRIIFLISLILLLQSCCDRYLKIIIKNDSLDTIHIQLIANNVKDTEHWTYDKYVNDPDMVNPHIKLEAPIFTCKFEILPKSEFILNRDRGCYDHPPSVDFDTLRIITKSDTIKYYSKKDITAAFKLKENSTPQERWFYYITIQ